MDGRSGHRQPFIPGGLPSSKHQKLEKPSGAENQDESQGAAPKSTNRDLAMRSSSDHASGELLSIVGNNKPLNTSAFARTKSKHPDNSFETVSAGSFSPRPNLAQSAPRVLASHPKRSAAPFFAPQDAVYHPQSLSPPTSWLEDEMSVNRAHIPSQDFSASHSAFAKPFIRGLGLPSAPRRLPSRPSLEKINEEPEDGPGSPEYARNPDPGATLRQDNDFTRPDSPQLGSYTNSGQPSLRRVHKRIERTDDAGSDVDEDIPETKRQKMASKPDLSDGFGTPPPPPPFSYPPLRNPPSYSAIDEADKQQRTHGLQRLLGTDLDVYVDAHVAAYEEAKKKWTECSLDEWTAGADDLAKKFSELIDFVKDHMTSKLKLFASLHATLDTHRAVLSGREEALKDARETLVRGGGNVVSGSLSGVLDDKEKKALGERDDEV